MLLDIDIRTRYIEINKKIKNLHSLLDIKTSYLRQTNIL